MAQSPFEIEVRRGVAASKLLDFYQDDGVTPYNVSALVCTLRVYTNDKAKTLLYTYTPLPNGAPTNEKVVNFQSTDVATPGVYYAELDIGSPATDGAWGYVRVSGH